MSELKQYIIDEGYGRREWEDAWGEAPDHILFLALLDEPDLFDDYLGVVGTEIRPSFINALGENALNDNFTNSCKESLKTHLTDYLEYRWNRLSHDVRKEREQEIKSGCDKLSEYNDSMLRRVFNTLKRI